MSNSFPEFQKPPVTSDQRRFNSRLGLGLFLVNIATYGGFLAAFANKASGNGSDHGANSAVFYGTTLIVTAFVLALVYGVLRRKEPSEVTRVTEITD